MFNSNMYGFGEIDPNGLFKLLENGEVALIDVRGAGELAHGVIEGARHVPLHLLPLRAHEMDKDIPHVYYCRSGARSAQACAFMAGQGHGKSFNLQGGIIAWVQSGLGLAKAATGNG
ncbi:MAG: rhodanese-like domain-containing protein [Methylobacter sp.]